MQRGPEAELTRPTDSMLGSDGHLPATDAADGRLRVGAVIHLRHWLSLLDVRCPFLSNVRTMREHSNLTPRQATLQA